jgi:hypothetical protein
MKHHRNTNIIMAERENAHAAIHHRTINQILKFS